MSNEVAKITKCFSVSISLKSNLLYVGFLFDKFGKDSLILGKLEYNYEGPFSQHNYGLSQKRCFFVYARTMSSGPFIYFLEVIV